MNNPLIEMQIRNNLNKKDKNVNLKISASVSRKFSVYRKNYEGQNILTLSTKKVVKND